MHLDCSVNKGCVRPFLWLTAINVLVGLCLSSGSVDG